MKEEKSLIGNKFGEWEVIDRAGSKWVCKCSCGNTRTLAKYQLTSGRSKSCGHNTASLKNILGEKFGELTVTEYVGDGEWKCKCSCGNETVVLGTSLRYGNTKSCGHAKVKKSIDITGEHFGEWEVIKYVGNSYWECRCSCGTKKNVHSYSLRSGKSTNCGNKHRLWT